jgi:hypothetical protein
LAALNDDPEIAFVPNGSHLWIAKERIEAFTDSTERGHTRPVDASSRLKV